MAVQSRSGAVDQTRGLRKKYMALIALGAILLGLLATGSVTAGGPANNQTGSERVLILTGNQDEEPQPSELKPWDRDPAPAEAAAKISFYEKLMRWSEEPTQNQLNMDAIYYDLSLEIDPDTETINGVLLGRFRVDAPEADELDLDLADGLAVTAVTINGAPAAYVHQNEIITITLDHTYYQDEEVEVEVSYEGTPPGSYGAFGFDSYGGHDMIWTLSEPFGARSWWPCDDWSDDKADSVDLHITIPQGLIVASNGVLREVTHGVDTDTYYWHEGYPIATYLVSLAIYPYTVYSDYYHYAPGDSMEIQFFIFPGHVAQYYDDNAMVKDMIAFYATIYGEYPFLDEKYGHAEFLWGGGMEHQTCTSLGAFFETIIAHELSHQWWGDMVTCADFHDIWLNEGFAVYSEALWLEHNYGPDGYWGKMNSTRYYGGGTIYVPDLSDWSRIFHLGLTYYKASWVVHMLRHVIGDENFFDFLPAYRQAFEYGAANTEDLQSIAETVSGMDLSDFFQQWIYEEYYPVYAPTWENVDAGDEYELHLNIDQIQTNTVIYHMPIDIRVEVEGGPPEEFVVDNSEAHQEYILSIPGPATAVHLDPDEWILKGLQEPIVNPTFSNGILLVNGVDWNTYGNEIRSAYEDQAFWGNLEISFWDCFAEPSGGYPQTLPPPLGHGRVPSSALGGFEAVIWVGNNYGGDLFCWQNTSIMPYLEAGGNVLLMTRHGEFFLNTDMLDYLGITQVNGSALLDCISVHEELTDIGRIGMQSYCMVFDQELSQQTSTLLYLADQGYDPDVGIGVLRAPTEGGTHNPDGARFAFLSGRPYRWDHVDLRTNVETIVSSLFLNPAGVPDEGPAAFRLQLRLASPVLGGARLIFRLPRSAPTRLLIYDSQGRVVRTLVDGVLKHGQHHYNWDGRADSGEGTASGIYFVHLRSGGSQRSQPMLLLR